MIAWSIANEPDTAEEAARPYFAPLVAATRELDPTRPVCFANVATAPPEADVVTDLFDLICVNRYFGWYADTGDLAAAERELEDELRAWARHGKPIVVTEFGADALAGLHALPAGPVVRGLPGGADRGVAAGVPARPGGHRRARVELR